MSILTDKKRSMISFRLRKIDDDLQTAINGIEGDDLSELCRNGLRLILGIKKTRERTVSSRPIAPVSLPKVYVPNQRPRPLVTRKMKK